MEENRSRKRHYVDAHHNSSHKRSSQERAQTSGERYSEIPLYATNTYRSMQGTQHNPFEIDSSPEPEPKAESRNLPKTADRHGPLGEDEVQVLERGPSKKFYAVAAGHVPGIYVNWSDAEKQVSGFYGNVHKSFKSFHDAWNYLDEKKNIVRSTIKPESRLSQIPTAAQPLLHVPQFLQSPSLSNETTLSPSKDYISITHPPPFDPLPSLGTQDLPPPYSHHAQSTQSTASANVLQPNVQIASVDEPEPVLSSEQQHVVDLIMEGHNVFYTGSAGCGKSTILKAFVKRLREQGKHVRIVAPTNLAALNVNGQTTWNFAGWTPDSMKRPLAKLKAGAFGNEVWQRFDSTDVLVIDEISMVENHVFERLNQIMKESRGEKYGGGAFGGVQLVVTGDFCQLSPVKPFQYCIGCGWELKPVIENGRQEYECENKKGCGELRFKEIDKWAFRSKAWQECDFKHINLTEIHRQSDRRFISILQRIRTDGIILKPHANVLLNHKSETKGAIKLYARRDDVDLINREQIFQLPSEPITYKCSDHFSWKDHHKDERSLEKNTRKCDDGTLAALKEHRYEKSVLLKEGMRIVLQANLDSNAGLVNGSQGTIISFEPYASNRLPRKAENRNEIGSLDSPVLRGAHAGYAEQQIISFAKDNGHKPWPVVEFDNGLTKTIYADCTASELGNEEPYSLLSRTQIPLAAGYAITIHKSQGMTLNRVIVNLSRAFEASQIYVALSRARSLDGLKVEGLPRNPLGGANAQVKEFFENYLSKK